MRALYTITIFLGSALLFLVEPMVAKMILPVFGGSAAVWNASVVFFQLLLLGGYAYAHASTKRLGTKAQPILHLAIVALALLALPFSLKSGYFLSPTSLPAFQVIGLLLIMVGLPFFALSAQAPLIQKWFAKTPDPAARDPYFLYSASNVGSVLALLAYPTLIEPWLSIRFQARLWTYGYIALAMLTAASSVVMIAKGRHDAPDAVDSVANDPRPTNPQRMRWLLLAAVPASLMLGVTNYLTTNIAPVPLLWIIPLAVYLISFILAFSSRIHPNPRLLARISTILVLPLALVLVLELWTPMIPLAMMHLTVLFMLSWTCHLFLARSRPAASHLTEFYLWVAAGGVLGGAFNAFLAPVAFDGLIEYPIALAVAIALFQRHAMKDPKMLGRDVAVGVMAGAPVYGLTLAGPLLLNLVDVKWGENSASAVTMGLAAVMIVCCFFAIDRPVRYGLILGSVMILGPGINRLANTVLYQTRDFFGVKRVQASGPFHILMHGSTDHGEQNTTPGHRREPLTYFNYNSPIGRFFNEFSGSKAKRSVAVVGLGTGTLAAYGQAGQDWTFYEIDPDVIRIASDPRLFTYLSDCPAKLHIVQGDARLELAKASPASYDLIVLDAFNSDSIPVHLVTREAIEMYKSKLRPGGVLAFHTSNRYLDLPPVIARAGNSLDMHSIYLSMDIVSPEEEKKGWSVSRWMLMARNESDFGALGKDIIWQHMDHPKPGSIWTDDFSNVLTAFAINNQP